ncbi:glutamate--tRNA ligase [Helicobacter saguini]|uniref:Glutamate--tRNA ligase n=1 Tax=Helicobacter saguini TaxID=1548018 RepID=A0A347VRZ9_9HELI|nr:glutamate--tRNA ligase [Helicobacter saguini]MWV62711.1 glutamate--tRNA ligase [Helicobacter saguini]MWV66618.1 glutamate--tRNA ligase [Helicobacter saguini]MWV68968.1 glutamate--tRNA ligase [Helicobacter saguini]MWV71479.1 glutamate--tRNA ligase [Helicobacter saguini]TLD94121.1 glutamate--tRNA ligase [Helicobacter saguini]
MLRFAPSPTGDMHIGNLRAAIFNFLMAKKLHQKFIIRIEDTDLERNIDNKDKDILDLLKAFRLSYDDLIYQSDNFPLHRELAHKLIKEGKAFYCYCSKEFLESKREEARIQKKAFRYKDEWAELEKGDRQTSNIIRLHANKAVRFKDEIKGEISFSAGEIDSFVIMRNDVPTYNFACSIDDKEMSYIIRGEDHISNTPKQILIKEALGFGANVKYAHLPIILNDENKKMSKRDAASSVKWLISQGLEPQAIANYLIIMGNSSVERACGELFDYNSVIDAFDVANISSNPAHFDYKKMLQINRDLLRKKPIESFYYLLDSINLNGAKEADFKDLITLYLGESNSVAELKTHLENTFNSIESKREMCEFKDEFDKILGILKTDSKNFESYEDFKNHLSTSLNLKGKNLFKPLRILLSGQPHGIEIDKLYNALKDKMQLIINHHK